MNIDKVVKLLLAFFAALMGFSAVTTLEVSNIIAGLLAIILIEVINIRNVLER